MAKQIPPGITIQEVGAYLVDAGIILEFFHGSGFQLAGVFATELGQALETGTGSFGPLPQPVPQQDGQYLVDAGLVLGFFHSSGLQAAGIVLTELGSAVEIGQGTVGPIRIGGEGLTLTVNNWQVSGSIAPWPG